MAAIRAKDVLVQHPYDSFSTSVQAFVEQAAADPKVLAIKQTLYRTSGDSPIIDALIDAAEAGKQVLAVVEIKARFDEQNNIEWARKLEHAGVHVVYGVVGLKTHCKLSLVVRQETRRAAPLLPRRHRQLPPEDRPPLRGLRPVHLRPTGRRGPHPLFNQLSGWAPRSRFKRLLVAPRSLRSGLIDKVEEQIAARRPRVRTPTSASRSTRSSTSRSSTRSTGPRRPACRSTCWSAASARSGRGCPACRENIRVRSILGRFLEHSRVFVFGPRRRPTVSSSAAPT